jgi:hypothetical protein
MAVRAIAAILLLAGLAAQERPIDFVCPMDPDVHSPGPAKCPRCGMKLVAGLPEPREYPVQVKYSPTPIRPGSDVELSFRVLPPKAGEAAPKLELIHERLFHLFIVSEDLEFFAHDHPQQQKDGSFRLAALFPHGGMYRLLCDFYPAGATPQLIPKTLFVRGNAPAANLRPDLSPKRGANLNVGLRTEPAAPLAGKKTMLFFDVDPGEELEPYLGARGHLLAASGDLIDMIHSHPAFDDPGRVVQFNVIFPRPGLHRVWVQFQRRGVVNTVSFTLPVIAL